MKKRFVSFLAISLLLALLSSCTAGLPGSELYFAARDAVEEFSHNLELLFAGDITLAQSGKANYQLVGIHDPVDEVKNAVESFQKAFKKRAGAELRICDESADCPKIWIQPTKEELRDAIPKLSANSFYIGFVGEDLVIHAENTIMLISALSYFEEELLPLAKDGALALSRTLSYVAPTQLCENNQYVITRAEAASETAISAISKLHDALHTHAGIRVSIKSDFNTTGAGAKEFLVGTPDRVECDEILPLLDHTNYYIGCTEDKIMILATSDQMLDLAVDRFIETFVTAPNALCDKEQKSIQLPAECHYLYKVPGAMLANEGNAFAVLVHPQNISDSTRNAINTLCSQFQRLTNTTLSVLVDTEYERRADTFEILIGETNRAESTQHKYGVPVGDWTVAMELRALVVLGDGAEQLENAIAALGNLFTEQAAKSSPVSIYYEWWNAVIPNVNRMLYLPEVSLLHIREVQLPTTPRPR